MGNLEPLSSERKQRWSRGYIREVSEREGFDLGLIADERNAELAAVLEGRESEAA